MSMTATRRLAPAVPLIWPAILASAGLLAMGLGGVLPLVPLAGVAVLALLFAAPMRWTALAVTAIALLVDNPGERPSDGRWHSPLAAPGELLYLNLHKITGIGALRFSALELLFGVLMVILVRRKLQGDAIDDARGLGALPNPMKQAFAVMFGAIVWLMLYGLARRGDFTNALWQVRQLFWLPVLGVLFGHALKTEAARLWLVRIVIAVACVRALEGIWFHYAVAGPQGLVVEYATTHSDSILAVVAILLALMALIARPSRDHLLLNLVTQPVLFLGLIANDRRLAFVSLLAGAFVALLRAPASVKQLLKRVVLLMIPFMLLYTAAGWNSNAGVFKPVGIIKSVINQDDASSETRDIENYNLVQTLKAHPIAGSGFGHEYKEVVQAYRVDLIFAQYRFIAHNSVLWLISLSGWLGFALLWAVFPTAVLVSQQVMQRARSLGDILTAFGAIAAILAFLLQAWGDMGLQSWMGTMLVAAFMGATGALHTSMDHEGRLA